MTFHGGVPHLKARSDVVFSSKGYHFPCKRFSSATIQQNGL